MCALRSFYRMVENKPSKRDKLNEMADKSMPEFRKLVLRLVQRDGRTRNCSVVREARQAVSNVIDALSSIQGQYMIDDVLLLSKGDARRHM